MADGRAYLPGAHMPAAEIRRRVAAAWPGTRGRRRRRRAQPGARRRSGALLSPRADGGGAPAAAPARRFGVISPMTEHFCTTCNRLRLSTAGALHACLAYDDAVDLRGPLHAGRRGRGRRRDSRRRSRENAPDTRFSSSGSADPARRWYKSADDRRRAAQATNRRPGPGVRGTPGGSVRDSQRQHGSGPPRRDGRVREAGRRHCCARRARSVDTIDTGGFPMVVGRFFQDASFPTVTVYNHLDVQPADGEGWHTPPFKLTRDARGGAGPARWFARGSTDDKGPALTALYGARLAIENGVRANIQFLWELEEEIGSPHFAAGLSAAVAGDAAAGRAPLAHRFGGRVGHDLDRGRAAFDLVRSARPDGIHGGARDRRQGRPLRDHGRSRAQSDRRARGAGRRVLRRAHRAR